MSKDFVSNMSMEFGKNLVHLQYIIQLNREK